MMNRRSSSILDIFQVPFMIEITGEREYVFHYIRRKLKMAREEVNELFDEPVYIAQCRVVRNNKIQADDVFFLCDDDDDEIDYSQNIIYGEEAGFCFKIKIGDEVVLSGDIIETDDYKRILPIAKTCMEVYHDRIIDVQHRNQELADDLELDESNDEILFHYYERLNSDRAFFFLKNLATKYPKSHYQREYISTLRRGGLGYYKNKVLANKIEEKSNLRVRRRNKRVF